MGGDEPLGQTHHLVFAVDGGGGSKGLLVVPLGTPQHRQQELAQKADEHIGGVAILMLPLLQKLP